MRIVTKADEGQWLKATNEYERIIATAATKAMRAVGREGVQAGRAAIAAGGFSGFVQKTLRAINKPASGYVLNPSVWIHSTVNYLDVFETGKTITGSLFLWLPLPNVPPKPGTGIKFGGIIGREHMTPSQYVRLVGPLVTMRRPGKLPMLGAVISRPPKAQPFGKFASKTILKRGTAAKGQQETIPMFVAVASINIPKKFDVHAAIEEADRDFEKLYKENLEVYEGRS